MGSLRSRLERKYLSTSFYLEDADREEGEGRCDTRKEITLGLSPFI
jgi:hypothetical protein